MTSESSPWTWKEVIASLLLIFVLTVVFAVYGYHEAYAINFHENDSIESLGDLIVWMAVYSKLAESADMFRRCIIIGYACMGCALGCFSIGLYAIVRVISQTKSRLRQIRIREAAAVNSPDRQVG